MQRGSRKPSPRSSSTAPDKVHAFWYDSRDGDGARILRSYYHSVSLDGGVNWQPNRRLSEELMYLNPYGFYNQSAAIGQRVLAAWADARLSNISSSGGDVYCALVDSTVVGIEVENLAALQSTSGVLLTWRLSVEALRESSGLIVQRAEARDGPFVRRTPSPLVPAAEMTFTDEDVVPGRPYWYRLLLMKTSGQSRLSPTVGITPGRSSRRTDLLLSSVQRNRTSIELRFVVGAQRTSVRLGVYDASGKEVWSSRRENSGPGEYVIMWDGRNAAGALIPRGVYFVRLQTVDATVSKKLVLLGE